MIFFFTGWSSVNLLLVFNVDGYSHLGAGTTRPGLTFDNQKAEKANWKGQKGRPELRQVFFLWFFFQKLNFFLEGKVAMPHSKHYSLKSCRITSGRKGSFDN